MDGVPCALYLLPIIKTSRKLNKPSEHGQARRRASLPSSRRSVEPNRSPFGPPSLDATEVVVALPPVLGSRPKKRKVDRQLPRGLALARDVIHTWGRGGSSRQAVGSVLLKRSVGAPSSAAIPGKRRAPFCPSSGLRPAQAAAPSCSSSPQARHLRRQARRRCAMCYQRSGTVFKCVYLPRRLCCRGPAALGCMVDGGAWVPCGTVSSVWPSCMEQRPIGRLDRHRLRSRWIMSTPYTEFPYQQRSRQPPLLNQLR